MNKQMPIYIYPRCYVGEYGELEQYRTSYQANIVYKEAIEQSIAATPLQK